MCLIWIDMNDLSNMIGVFQNLSLKVQNEICSDDYIENGLLHCHKCHTPKQCRVKIGDMKIIVNCICKCSEAEYKKQKALKDKEKEQKRLIDLKQSLLSGRVNQTFEIDKNKDSRISMAMRKYADNFDKYKKLGTGLLLYGNVGTGKTFYSVCIADKLIDNGYYAKFTTFSEIADEIQANFSEKQNIINKMTKYDLLCLDDLGVERQSDYMMEIVTRVIDKRVSLQKSMIISTNLSVNEIYSTSSLDQKRVYDRMLSVCCPVKFTGESMRKEQSVINFNNMKSELGL